MELLRFFAEDHPDLHVIVTGSLMEVVMRGKGSCANCGFVIM